MMRAPGALLHRRLSTLLALIALAAFVSGAGFNAPAVLPAAVLLTAGLFWSPPDGVRRRLELFWRTLALLLALRAGYQALFVPADLVPPMVDLLLLLVVAETSRAYDAVGEARLYALTFALLIAATAYRPGSAFGIAFVAYLAVLTAALIIGQLNRQARRRRLPAPVITRGLLLQSIALAGLPLAASVAVFLVFPRVSWGARGSPAPRTVVGFADRVSLLGHGSRIHPNPQVVLRVEFPGDVPPPPEDRYWRGRSYDRFDGWSWSRTASRVHRVVEAQSWPAGRIEQLIYQAPLADANVLFGLSPVLDIRPHSSMYPFREANGDYGYGGGADPVYTAVSVAGQPAGADLRAAGDSAARAAAAGGTWLPPALRNYLQLPPLPVRVYALADSFARQHRNHYDRAVAVQDWLRRNFSYTLELPASAAEASLDRFLFVRRAGHCEYFSTALAVLLRATGVPTRNVNGFLGGEWNEFGDFLTVTQNQAHSWVEVWFPRHGWVRFDPTPTGPAVLSATARAAWWSPFRLAFADVEHRWSKWVLDYGLEDQDRIMRRLTAPLRSAPAGDERASSGSWQRPLLTVLGLLALVAFLRLRPPSMPGARAAVRVSRPYLKLRRAYARAGFPHSAPPLVFLQQLEQARAPGREHAADAVRRYALARFGGQALAADEYQRLRDDVRAALRLLRRGPRAAS